MDNKKLVPQIRFKGFLENWKKKKLGDIGKTYNGLVGKTKDDFGHGNAYYITYLNIFNNPIINTKLLEPIEIDFKQNKVLYGDIFFTTSSETPEDVGMSSVWLYNYDNIYLNSFCFGYRLNNINENNLLFFTYILRSSYVRKKIAILAQGISRYNISKNKLMELNILFTGKEEQDKIGNYFHQLDKLIMLNKKKIEKISDIKQTLLKKMFPSKNSDVPEIRFKGFTEKWEKKKLGSIATIIMGQSPKSTYYSNKQVGEILVQGNADLVNGYVEPRIWTTQVTKKALAGDLIMSVRAPAGAMGKTKYDVVLGRGVAAIRGNEFLYQALVKMYQYKFWNNLSTGSTFESLNSMTISQTDIIITSLSEQEKIGNYFYKLDNLINLYEKEIEKLQKLKKAFFGKMFV